MRALMCSAAIANATLVAAGLITPSPATPEIATSSIAVQLTADGDLANVPLNLLYDIINIPANALKALDALSYALFFSGSWLVTSATNVLGVDLADAPKFLATTDLQIPIPALSKPIGEQLVGFLAAEIPSNTACAEGVFCTLDGWIALFKGYGQVPISELLNGYTFPTEGPSITDPYGAVEGALGFPGTGIGSDGSDVYPWAGTTFTLDLGKPWADYWTSLTADPPADPLVSMPNVFHVLIDYATSWYVMLNPFLPPGPYIPDYPWLDTDAPAAADFSTPVDGLAGQLGDLWNSLVS
ncbi:hypothetical protein [Mycolicibacter icosiumassiliensis]|uniref:hypothetical protein n=1 Tax=Mycolicibacter icosiumassiliensis TaxID=1792835 RepID=UPI000ABF2FA1|nr:hypothetical protein [Mycolicibacter icosiumassiliensis]